MTTEMWVHRERSVPERALLRSFVAELDGRVVGESWVFREWWTSADRVQVFAAVRGHARGRGIGSALYDEARAHADAIGWADLYTRFHETETGVAFARARGFREARADRYSALEPRTVGESPAVEVRPAADVDPRILYAIDEGSVRDMPGAAAHEANPFEDWEAFVLGRPLLRLEGSFVAYADGEPAAIAMLTADFDTGRGTNMYTGTLPGFRGRGLAYAAKVALIRWAAEHGITQLVTHNDETNAAMLAINDRLGYRPVGRRVEYVLA
jgi:GNAT superfamily N-acetyltransferase